MLRRWSSSSVRKTRPLLLCLQSLCDHSEQGFHGLCSQQFQRSPSRLSIHGSIFQTNEVLFSKSKNVEVLASKRKYSTEASPSLKDYSEIPGPRPLPLVGNLLFMLRHPEHDITRIHKLWESFVKQFGPIVKLKFPGAPPMVITANADDIETFMKSTLNNPIREGFVSLKKVRNSAPDKRFEGKTGLLPENNEEWWRLRSRVQTPLLQPRKVEMYLPDVDDATGLFMDRIDLLQEKTGGVPDNFLDELYKWALECVGLVALDRKLGCLEPNLSEDSMQLQLIKRINEVFSALNETEMGLHTWRLYRSPAYVRLETAHNAFIEIADKSINEAAESLKAAKAAGDSDPDRRLTVMETFLNTDGLSKSDVTTMILDMLFAGVDTTSHSVAFTLYLLARFPAAQKTLQEEVDTIVGDAKQLKPEHLKQMVFLKYIMKESLRLFPLTIATSRVLTSEIEMSGYKVPAGVLVIGLNMTISRYEKYFQHAESFLPERWSKARPHGPIHPFASLPWSHGKRMCIGRRIAEQEFYIFLIKAMQKYTVSFDSTDEMDVKTQLVVKPNIPLPFRFTKRR